MQDLKYHLPQERRVSTDGMGPKSKDLDARRQSAVALSLIHI